ncbi:hypothetical protein YYC_01056 [Plasmodium yoelii 17X]|uniref:Uncharacterized protein n=4 Tax=Plasmodium yoelii TaxID=5861 RepID=A0AAF0B642_PLAYO|nr:conserved Plasmodium protein, unknown function [Plasmodium yoelii]EAA15497.1 hypothetical protein [Plasmodium yoelii yoelii]ETB62492.1 hypothetical protein YYC_01056 [Plasmodium yoelii 17X]WBY59491.1 hypothetical protein Py17XNL_001205298 [Plasmodium yoelii yoelii]CDU19610.1 conserved Plasmodium protein, unknown function [Plasmodium yoelii]VTZ80246.1 conserved Plasmodium protein, unknown function [Plasmodium yoelii]|eukprot:XP_723932.1 conserved Plasmodium protein, unknown function [Plasmodium yoelii]
MEFKKYCPFEYPKERDINGIDDILESKDNLRKLKNKVLNNLNLDNIYYDYHNKIKHKECLLNNNDDPNNNKKWYLYFQPLNNISIEQYWKYDKVTIKDILSSNINTNNSNDLHDQLKKNKKYLKYISKSILKGNPHESLIKNTFKYSDNYINNSDKYTTSSINNNMAPSLLSLNTKAIKNSQSLLNWKLKYSNKFSKSYDHSNIEDPDKASITLGSTSLSITKKNIEDENNSKTGNSDVHSTQYKMK